MILQNSGWIVFVKVNKGPTVNGARENLVLIQTDLNIKWISQQFCMTESTILPGIRIIMAPTYELCVPCGVCGFLTSLFSLSLCEHSP